MAKKMSCDVEFPTARNTFLKFDVLISGKTQTHKPFAVDFFGHTLQQRYAALAICNQVVVGGEDAAIFRCSEIGGHTTPMPSKTDFGTMGVSIPELYEKMIGE